MSSLSFAHFAHAANRHSSFTFPLILPALIIFCLFKLYGIPRRRRKTPEGVPWVGRNPNETFAETRVFVSALKATRTWLAEGYKKVRICLLACMNKLPPTEATVVYEAGQTIRSANHLRETRTRTTSLSNSMAS